MTPAYDLNLPSSSIPFIELQEDQYFIPSVSHTSSSLSSSSLAFDVAQDQRASDDQRGEPRKDQYKAHWKHNLIGGSSDHQAILSSSVHEINGGADDGHEISTFKPSYQAEDQKRAYESPNHPSDTRLFQRKVKQQKIMHSFHDQQREQGGSGVVRTCSDCNTTKTPLWRSGPQGPKSLCNACGIRRRKARRALAAAAESTTNNPSARAQFKAEQKENKVRNSFKNMAKSNKALKLSQAPPDKLSFEDFALSLSKKYSTLRQAFPKDEEEAAVLLMALSCGLLHG
ncbi:hypothetical protein NMG60_11027797 [Bertholletia excelsa]